jgi:hypothetical protein
MLRWRRLWWWRHDDADTEARARERRQYLDPVAPEASCVPMPGYARVYPGCSVLPAPRLPWQRATTSVQRSREEWGVERTALRKTDGVVNRNRQGRSSGSTPHLERLDTVHGWVEGNG